MRMSQLSSESGVPVASIKLYLREGLLPAGLKSGPNQAQYDEGHLRRLRMIQALLRVGRLSIASAREVLAAIDSDAPLVHVFGVAQRAATAAVDPDAVEARELDRVDDLLEGWRIEKRSPGRLAAAAAMGAFGASGLPQSDRWYRRYADAALAVAEADLDIVDEREGRDAKAETVVVGTVLGDALFAGLRRAAQEHVSATRHLAATPATSTARPTTSPAAPPTPTTRSTP